MMLSLIRRQVLSLFVPLEPYMEKQAGMQADS